MGDTDTDDKTKFTDALDAKLRTVAPPPVFTSFAPAPLIPLGPQTLSDRQISCVIQGHYKAVQTADKSWIVHVPPTGCTVTSVASTTGSVSSKLNIPGDQNADVHGTNETYPLPVVPGDALVILSGSTGGNPTAAYWQAPTSSVIDEAMAVVFVPYAVSENILRPPAIGRRTNPIVYFLRTNSQIPHSLMDMSKLPSIIHLDDIYQVPGHPTPNDADKINPTFFSYDRPTWQIAVSCLGGEVGPDGLVTCGGRFAGDIYSDYSVAGRCPWTQHGGYGAFFASGTSRAMLMLCTDEDRVSKIRLALALCQRGLDDFGRVMDGAYLESNGGHAIGRRVGMTLFGFLIGMAGVADYTRVVGDRVAEDNGFPEGSWWFGSAAPWTVRFPHTAGNDAFLANPPSTWQGGWNTSGDIYNIRYWGSKMPALTGGAAALLLMGAEKYAPRYIQAIRQWQERLPAAQQAEMAAVGVVNADIYERKFDFPFGFSHQVWHKYIRGLPGLVAL